MFTDEQVIEALRAWWELGPDEALPWDSGYPDQERFRVSSMRDMRAALEAVLKTSIAQLERKNDAAERGY